MNKAFPSIGHAPWIGAERRQMAIDFLRFGVVGTGGFIVDAVVLTAALVLGLGPWLGRLVSYVAAASTTFALNRAWTFRARRGAETQATALHGTRQVGRQWALFLAVNLVGFACNYGTYAALVAGVALVARNPVLGVAAGSIAGLAGNFLLSRRFVFRQPLPARPIDIP